MSYNTVRVYCTVRYGGMVSNGIGKGKYLCMRRNAVVFAKLIILRLEYVFKW